MKYKAVIFDLDGTLLDTLEDIADSANIVLKRFGFPEHDLESYKYFIGNGLEKLVIRAIPEDILDETLVAQYVAAMREEYSKRWANKTRPYGGIPELLDSLTTREVKMAILSNKPNEFTKKIVAELLPRWQFETILGSRSLVPKKPDPTAALEIAGSLKISPGDFLFLGDSSIDMETAIAAGMYPVGVLWGFRTADELTASGAKVLIERSTDLLKLF